MLESIVGLTIWLVANFTYARLRRSGTEVFGRVVAFWFGLPMTAITMIRVPEGTAWEETDQGIDSLIDEIRDDRELRDDQSEPHLIEAPDTDPKDG